MNSYNQVATEWSKNRFKKLTINQKFFLVRSINYRIISIRLTRRQLKSIANAKSSQINCQKLSRLLAKKISTKSRKIRMNQTSHCQRENLIELLQLSLNSSKIQEGFLEVLKKLVNRRSRMIAMTELVWISESQVTRVMTSGSE